ncbi:MAG: hypothetical protein IPH20_25810 [Bacteroidales bacterium]|nr:hypothetical protein [Bacteroidales bacterium]
MKKLTIILIMAGFSFAGFNQVIYAQTEQSKQQVVPQDEKDFKMIELTALPDEVRTAALKNDQVSTIQSAEVKILSTGEKVYRVNLKSIEKGEFSTKFYADGKPYEK